MKFYRVMALLQKYYYITKNSMDRIFDIVYWPILDIFIWGFATAFIEDISDVNLLSMFMGGIILWVFVWRASQDLAVFVLEDFWGRNLYNLFTTPVRSSELVASIIAFSVQRSLVSFGIQALLAYLLYSFNIFSINLIAIAAFVGILMIFGWATGLFITGMIYRFGSRIQVFAWSVTWIIQPFSCVFYPLSALPAWAQKIAVILPTTHIFEAMRAVIYQTGINTGSIIYALGISIALLIAGAFYIKASLEKAKKTGLLTRFD